METNKRLIRPLITIGLTMSIALTGAIVSMPAPASAAEEEIVSNSSIERNEAAIDLREEPIAAEMSMFSISSNIADRIIATGNRYLGTPYKYGSPAGSTRTFDCSSFTQFVFKQNGLPIFRTARMQATQGKYVPRSQLRKGDLVFFSTRNSGGKIAHVAIYAGNGKILHTFGPGGVKYSNLNSSWWSSHYITARRYI